VHTNDEGADVRQAYQELQAGADRLPLRVWWDMGVTDFETAVAWGWRTGQGDEWFKIGSLKLFADGSLGGHTAALKEPYAGDPGECGLLIWETERMAEQMARARRQGLQVAVHAIGDGAAEQVLQAFGQAAAQAAPDAGPVHPAVARLRLIHCQIMFPALWAEMVRLGAVAEVQPRFVASDYPIVEARVGAARAAVSYAWRSMGELGIPLAFGSDCPVEPVNPLHAIYAAVTRQTMEGEPEGGWLPQERLTVAEAIAGHTRGAAYAVGEEREKGQLAPGYLGDLVMLEQDPFAVPPAELKDVEVAATVVGGRVVFARG
jgi:predicted amidohydrolase YtcJ